MDLYLRTVMFRTILNLNISFPFFFIAFKTTTFHKDIPSLFVQCYFLAHLHVYLFSKTRANLDTATYSMI